ncbi:MAG: hypothetical protein ACM3MF_02415, partial [Anaerolineae bacterium]
MRAQRSDRKAEKKLYCVRVTLYVMAENTSEACVAATRAPFDIFECTARKADHVDPDWATSIPYNADDERTCAQILAASQLVEVPTPLLTIDTRRRATL